MQNSTDVDLKQLIHVVRYLYDHHAGDKEVGGGDEDPKRVCVTRGKTMQKSKSGIVLNSNHSVESKVVLAIYVNQIGLVNSYACVCMCMCGLKANIFFPDAGAQ